MMQNFDTSVAVVDKKSYIVDDLTIIRLGHNGALTSDPSDSVLRFST